MPNISAKRELLAHIVKMQRKIKKIDTSTMVGQLTKPIATKAIVKSFQHLNNIEYELCFEHLSKAHYYYQYWCKNKDDYWCKKPS